MSTEELFRSHAPFVARMLYRLGVPASELDDIVQEVFVVVHRLGGYEPGAATPTTYLANIAIKAAASARRKENTRRVRHTADSADDLTSPWRGPVQLLEIRDDMLELESTLAVLEPELRALFILVELEGERCADIAASQHIPVGTVYWRLHRARQRFQEAVKLRNARQQARALSNAEGPCS
jgi:RNA polymerase sigma-70 factor, ECF subfamily